MEFLTKLLIISVLFLFYFVFLLTTNVMLEYENVYVINLNSRPDRLAFMTEILNEIQQPFIRTEAIDGNKLEELCEKKMPLPLNPKISYSCEDLIRNKSENKCLNGEIGCWLTHLQLYYQIVENFEKTGRDNPSIILEDDIDVDVNFKELVNKSLSNLPYDWEIFYVGCNLPAEIELLFNNIAISKKFYGTYAYVVRNADAAKKLISISNKSDCQVADHIFLDAIRERILRSYIAYPRIYASSDIMFGTDVQPEWKDLSHRKLKNKQLDESLIEKINKRKHEI